MATVGDVARIVEQIAPIELGESWDNLGLLLGDPARTVERLMTCLTLTPESVDEAVEHCAEMVIAHHPLPFKPVNRITTQSSAGELIWKLARAGISVFSPHTAWDSASEGINAQFSVRLALQSITPLIPNQRLQSADLGSGRCGTLSVEMDLIAFAKLVDQKIPHCRVRFVDGGKPIFKVGIACGSGGSFLSAALGNGCDVLVTGEATFHQCLEAKALGLSLLMIGHFASEKFAMLELANMLVKALPDLEIWSSSRESDPVSTPD